MVSEAGVRKKETAVLVLLTQHGVPQIANGNHKLRENGLLQGLRDRVSESALVFEWSEERGRACLCTDFQRNSSHLTVALASLRDKLVAQSVLRDHGQSWWWLLVGRKIPNTNVNMKQ